VKFEKYEVVPLRDHTNPVQTEERNAQFWGLYGIDEANDAYAVGDFSSKTDAEFIRDAIQAS
jgi:hypothetical protein